MTQNDQKGFTQFGKSLKMAFPPVVVQLFQTLLEPEASFNEVAKYLGMDPMLTSTVLNIVNSVSYSFSEKVTDLHRAAVAIGTKDLFNLLSCLVVQRQLKPAKKSDAERLFADWRLTIWSALAANALAEAICPAEARDAYLVAMLKDLPLFLGVASPEPPAFLSEVEMMTVPSEEQFVKECSAWGAPHNELTCDVMLQWGMPERLTLAARRHHDIDNVQSYPPLEQCVVYATRWAELLHGQSADSVSLVPFELRLMHVFNLSQDAMQKMRDDCALRFNVLIGQLGIKQAEPSGRLHDLALSKLQSIHFLAMETAGGASGSNPTSLAATLQRQFSMFWDLEEWELLWFGPHGKGMLYSCSKDGVKVEDGVSSNKTPKSGWESLQIVFERKVLGKFFLPRPKAESDMLSTLQIFMNAIVHYMNGESIVGRRGASEGPAFSSLAMPVVRLDSTGRLKEVSTFFMEQFGINSLASETTGQELLFTYLGYAPAGYLEVLENKSSERAWITVPPVGNLAGTVIYVSVSRGASPDSDIYLAIAKLTDGAGARQDGACDGGQNGSCCLIDEPGGLLHSLLELIDDQVYLLDGTGTVFWARQKEDVYLGRNIFTISKPDKKLQPVWNATLLPKLKNDTRVAALLARGKGKAAVCELTFSCVNKGPYPVYLLVAKEKDVKHL